MMADTYWHKQSADVPLFPDLIWNKPENKLHAGKLLIIGGNLYGFAAPGEAYNEAEKAGIGVAKVLLPDALQKTVGSILENGEFGPSNKSGSFSKTALAEWLSFAGWADAALLAGDFGRNSETAMALEAFIQKYSGLLIITKDTIDYFAHQSEKLMNREQTLLVLSIAQLQKLLVSLKWHEVVKFSMGIEQLVELLHTLTQEQPINIVVNHNGVMFVASNGEVSTTKQAEDSDIWRVRTAAHAAVWWLQNPNKPFEAITAAVSAK